MSANLICSLCSKGFAGALSLESSHALQDLPLLLVCGHTFCHQCLITLYEKKRGINCPACGIRTECLCDKNGIKGLYPHMSALGYLALTEMKSLNKLAGLMESVQKKKILKRSSSSLTCSECMQQTAVVNCVQCGVNICSECFDMIHQNSRILKRHQSIPIAKSAHNLSSLDCHKHHTLTDHFCVDDDALICQECLHEDHESHNVISIQEKSREMIPDVKRSLCKVSMVKSNLEKSISEIENEITNIHAEVKQYSNDILSYFMEVSGKLQSNYLMLMNDLEQIAYKQMRHLLTLRDAANVQLKNIEVLCGDARLILNSENDSSVVDPVKTLHKLGLAERSKCTFEKLTGTTTNNGDKSSTKRFSLKFNKDMLKELIEFPELHENQQFKYSSKEIDWTEVDGLSEESLSDSQSENSSLASEKPQNDKLMVVRVPPAQNQELVYVTLVSTPEDFYIQRHCDRPQLEAIEKGLKVFSFRPARQEDLMSCITAGELCAACTSVRKWCRAKVMRVIKQNRSEDDAENRIGQGRDEVELFLIDYGKLAKAKVSCLRSLPQNFHHIPPLAFACSLVAVRPYTKNGKWSEKAVQMFGKMVSNRPVLMSTMKREGGRRYVDLHKPAPDEIDHDIPVSVRDALVFMEMARFVPGSNLVEWPSNGRVTHREYFKPTSIPVRSYVNVVLSHYQSISRFFVQQLDSSAAYLEALSEKIQKFGNQKTAGGFDAASPFSILKPRVNMPCLAKYECCGMWFRAKITKVMEDEHQVEVYYVDYGNEAVVSVKQLLKIPDQFMKLPYQGLECRLSDIVPANDAVDWSQESSDRFFELVGDEQLQMLVRSHEEGVYSVELFDWADECRLSDNQLSVNERLVHEGLATGLTVHKVVEKKSPPIEVHEKKKKVEVSAKESDSPLKAPTSSDPNQRTVTVVHCKSPALFYTQSEEQWRASNKLTRELHKVMRKTEDSQMKKTSEWKESDHCVLYSLVEKRWCRGQLSKVDGETCDVQLVDFGCVEKVALSTLRDLPSHFEPSSPYVTACYIANIQPAGGKKWSSTAQDLFSEMVLRKQSRVELCGVPRGGVQPVKLFLPCAVDEDTEVGRELILRGVALPVIRLDIDKNCPESLSRTQQLFERKEADYQQAENLDSHSTPDLASIAITPISPFVSLSPENPDFIPPADQPIPLLIDQVSSPIEVDSIASSPITSTLEKVSSEQNVVVEALEIPYSDSLDPDSTFSCLVTHIEKYNIVCIKKLPVESVFPDGTEFIADAPLLKQYALGTPCLARFEEDHRWYRAEVTAQHGRTVFVCFVDYGLTQAIEDMEKLLVLPDEYKLLPRQAIVCSLPSMPSPVETSLPEEQYLTVLASLIGDKRFTCTVSAELDTEWGCPVVNLRLEKEDTPLSELLAAALASHDYKSL